MRSLEHFRETSGLGFFLIGSRSWSDYKNSKRLRQVSEKTSFWSHFSNQCITLAIISDFSLINRSEATGVY
jgi:hypothetical protein